MKAKYLKKLRKRYTWRWISTESETQLEVLDHKEKKVSFYWDSFHFIDSLLDLNASIEYTRRRNKRKNLAFYRRELKDINTKY